MEIFIKSFNRPYFLDRCIDSIYKNVKGFSKIVILDDGTPQKYLDKLVSKYTDIIIKKSEYYTDKSSMIESGIIQRSLLKFPGDFWYRECSTSKSNFLLLEDDMFIIKKIDLADIKEFMQSNHLQIFKLLWLGSPLMNQGSIIKKDKFELLFPLKKISLEHFKSKISNKFKKKSILLRLGLYPKYFKKNILPYYSIYIVAGAVYNKNYFDFIWKNIHSLNEDQQIIKTLEYYKSRNIELKVGKSIEEFIVTSFNSSATNEFANVDFSIFDFNKILNDAWLAGKLERLNENVYDISPEQIKALLSYKNFENWKLWRQEFTKGYQNLECRTV